MCGSFDDLGAAKPSVTITTSSLLERARARPRPRDRRRVPHTLFQFFAMGFRDAYDEILDEVEASAGPVVDSLPLVDDRADHTPAELAPSAKTKRQTPSSAASFQPELETMRVEGEDAAIDPYADARVRSHA